MNILISNDDGYHAIGIQTLAKILRENGANVTVIAPDRNRSAASSCLTLVDPLRVHSFNEQDYMVIAGTPADCVHLALNGLFTTSFDLVISGINMGANLGDDVLYSGTLAAALEGRHLPLPSLAISLVGRAHFDTAAKVTLDILDKIRSGLLPERQVLNINVPDLPYDQLKGTQITQLGYRSSAAEIVGYQDPRGEKVYWIGANGKPVNNHKGTDFYAISHGYVSITPIQADMTAYDSLSRLSVLEN